MKEVEEDEEDDDVSLQQGALAAEQRSCPGVSTGAADLMEERSREDGGRGALSRSS